MDRDLGDPVTGAPPWQVFLLGGASGVRKSRLGARLAARWGARLVEVDDSQAVLERVTTPQQYPEVHRWRLHPEEVLGLDDAAMLAHTRAYAAVMADALEPVIGSHLESGTPVVFEGDFILPSLATLPAYDGVAHAGRVRALFVVEQEGRSWREASTPVKARSNRDAHGPAGTTTSGCARNACVWGSRRSR